MDPLLQLLGITPPKFHLGQAIVCIDPAITHEHDPTIICHLSMSAIYRVCQIERRWRRWYLTLDTWQEFVFEEIHFAPVEELPAEALAELLADTLAPVVA